MTTPSDVPNETPRFASRGGLKLQHALDAFGVDPSGYWCADLGCSTGGFTDCLLQRGAQRVYSVDTGYGVLDYRLRMDPRVRVHERSNALHLEPPDELLARGGADLVTIDMSWTVQDKCLPAAERWLAPSGLVITLVKPHYEATGGPFREELNALVVDGVLPEAGAKIVLDRTLSDLPRLGFRVLNTTASPILGGKNKSKKRGRSTGQDSDLASTGTGNIEYLVLLTR